MTTEQLGQAVLELVVNDEALKDSLGKAKKTVDDSLKELGDSMTKTGKTLTKTLTAPIVAVFGLAVKEAGEEEEALMQLQNAIKNVGNEGAVSAQNLAALAATLQTTTRFADDQSLSALALLESLTGLNEEGLTSLLPLIQDFATMAGVDLQTAVRQAANIINGSTDSLGRYGKAVSDTSTGTERLTELTGFLSSKFQGAAEIAGTSSVGQFITLKNTFAELAETFGELMLPLVSKLVDFLKGIATALQAMDPETKNFILTLAGIAAAIGPLLVVGGKLIGAITSIISVVKGVGSAFSLLSSGPVGLIIAGVALLALGVFELIKNWDTVKAFFEDLWAKVVGFFKEAWEKIKEIIRNLWQWIKDHIEWILLAINPLAGGVAFIIKNWDQISAFFKKLWEDVKGFFMNGVNAVTGFVKNLYEGVKTWLVDKFMGIVNSVKEALDKVTGFFKDLYNSVVGHSIIPDLVNGVIDEFERMQSSVQDIVNSIMMSVVDLMGEAMFTLGESIIEGASAWEDFKKSAKDAIVAVLKMIGKELLIYAVKSLIPIPGVFNPVAAALAGAGAAAAFVAAGVVNALAEGGTITEPVVGYGTQTGESYLLGEAGPEEVTPLSGARSDDEPLHVTLMLDGKVFGDWLTRATKSRRVLIHAGAVV